MQGRNLILIAVGIAIGVAMSAAVFAIPDRTVIQTVPESEPEPVYRLTPDPEEAEPEPVIESESGHGLGDASVDFVIESEPEPAEPPVNPQIALLKEAIAEQEQFLQICIALDTDDSDAIDEYFVNGLDFLDTTIVKLTSIEEPDDPTILPYIVQSTDLQGRINLCQESVSDSLEARMSSSLPQELASGRVKPGHVGQVTFYENRIAYLAEIESEILERCISLDMPDDLINNSDPVDGIYLARTVGFGKVLEIIEIGSDALAVHEAMNIMVEDTGNLLYTPRLHMPFLELESLVDETTQCYLEKSGFMENLAGDDLESLLALEPESEPGAHTGTAARYTVKINELTAWHQASLDRCLALDPGNIADVSEYLAKDYLEDSADVHLEMYSLVADAESEGLMSFILHDFEEYSDVVGRVHECVDEKTGATERIHGQDAVRDYVRENHPDPPLSDPEPGDQAADEPGPSQAGFRDRTGYMPGWAAGRGENQILGICSNMGYEDYGSRDFNWCSEYSGYVLDHLVPAQKQQVFIDVTGHTPDWAAGKGEAQTLSICSNMGYEDYGSRDFNWCSEYSGYVLDKMSPSQEQDVFRDFTGYSPGWAEGKGDNQILGICSNMGYEDYGSRDFNWCGEFSGYVLDKLG